MSEIISDNQHNSSIPSRLAEDIQKINCSIKKPMTLEDAFLLIEKDFYELRSYKGIDKLHHECRIFTRYGRTEWAYGDTPQQAIYLAKSESIKMNENQKNRFY